MELTHAFDIERARRDTPGVDHVTHLNNAGAALPPTQVTDAVVAHLRKEAEIGGYEAAAFAAAQVENTYTAISSAHRLSPRARSPSSRTPPAPGTWPSTASPSLPETGSSPRRAEYASNVIAFLQVAARTGATIEIVDDDATGQLSLDDLRRRLHDGGAPVRLVAITHVPTQGGLVNPAEASAR